MEEYDVFVSHASEDKAEVARPLAEKLRARGLRVWFDEDEIAVGQGIRDRIADGIERSRCAVVVLSERYFEKQWAQRELGGLLVKEGRSLDVVLPVCHRMTPDAVRAREPLLGDKLALDTASGLDVVADRIVAEVLATRRVRRRRTLTRLAGVVGAVAVAGLVAGVIWPDATRSVLVRITTNESLIAAVEDRANDTWFEIWPKADRPVRQAGLAVQRPDSIDVTFDVPAKLGLDGAKLQSHSQAAIDPETAALPIQGDFAEVILMLNADPEADRPQIAAASPRALLDSPDFLELRPGRQVAELRRHLRTTEDLADREVLIAAIGRAAEGATGRGEWQSDVPACRSIWKGLVVIGWLPGDAVAFPSAGSVKMEELRFWAAAASAEVRNKLAAVAAGQLVAQLVQDGAGLREGRERAGALAAIAAVLSESKRTVSDLADAVRVWLQFAGDEG